MKLPPLNALRAFETAARTGAFTSAAEELGVSSAAVSQQVRKLEAYLGRTLFFRNNNQITLTDAGRDLYINAASALSQIAGFTAGLKDPVGQRPLVISALPSLAERWLPGMVARLERMAVRVMVAEDPVDMESDGVDIRISYGGDVYPGFWVQTLFADTVVPMARPGMCGNWDAREPDFEGLRLIEMDWGPSFTRTPKWSGWCLARGIAPPARVALTAPGGTAALALAEAGAGVALGQKVLARDALDQGRLEILSDVAIPVAQPYVAVVAHARLRRPRIQAALAVLASEN